MALFQLNLDRETREAIAWIAESLAGMREELRGIRFRLGRPGTLKIILLREESDMIQFKVVLPAVSDDDVVARELSVKIGAGEALVQTVAVDAEEVAGFEGEQDAAVSLALVDVDDAGNRSEASTLEAILLDTFPPAKPGELSIVATGESNAGA